MQTFLPLPNYYDSMNCLDKSRLGNQIWREGLTLIRGKWPNHPASKMWKNYRYHLGLYLLAGLEILEERNEKSYSEIRQKIIIEMNKYKNNGRPWWLGSEKLHASHRSNLLRKNKEYYSQFKWEEQDNLPYYWPIK